MPKTYIAMKKSKDKIATGNILLAEPFMVDGNFKRAMVLLCDHSEEGSLGFVLNKELDIPLNDLIADFPVIDCNVFFGGPVATDTVHYIHNVGETLEGSIEVHPGIWWGGDFEQLKFKILSGLVDETNIRFFVGYSGWENRQLFGELELGSWVISTMKYDYLFEDEVNDLWEIGMADKGDTFSILSEVPASNVQWS